MARSKSSSAWLHEHVTDHWVKRAKAEGWRSRAAFKLMEIDRRDRLLRSAMTVVDLGAAPGGWSQVAAKAVGAQGRVVAVDLLPMQAIAGVEFIDGDFNSDAVLARVQESVGNRPVDLVMSDMAPNISGIAATDQARALHLCELALEFARTALKPGGDMLVKVFQGSGSDEFRRALAVQFATVVVRKPDSSRDRSPELYLLARGKHA
ncbi:MAG: 23S rRNA (uridine(2552)-2'-O)-methyltransferase RlmE [Rhodocyclaceae bacterium]|nr:23S rRNA (uridine(2552)-2'-O)-methyltransferase RlmE [Rhodocyclaceae bacterium]